MNNTAFWTLLGVVVGGLTTGLFNFLLQRDRFKHEKDMFVLQNQSKENVKDIIEDLLNHKNFVERSFSAIKKRIGGYSEDEIRKMLHEVGAIKTFRNDGSEEWWYLKEREQEWIEIKRGKGK